METNRWTTPLVTAVAPITWGTTYIVTAKFLPEDRPLFAALVRALPVGLLMLAFVRTLPRGAWWWRSAVLGVCNIGVFYPLIFLSAYHLPGGIAATVQALLPLVVMAIAWPVIGERPTAFRSAAAVVGVAGVALLVLRSPDGVTSLGLVGALGSVFFAALGAVLVKRWPAPVNGVTLVSWQLVWGGLAILPVALLVEGPPPSVDGPALAGYLYIGLIGSALAYTCWFHGLGRMAAGAVALVGLVNPVVATLLGVAFNDETFGVVQALGALLVIGGVLLGQLGSRPAPAPPAGSADGDGDRVGGLGGVGVDDPELVLPGDRALHHGGEHLVTHLDGDREV